jgi:Cys-rich protein (TIGR01571 family)
MHDPKPTDMNATEIIAQLGVLRTRKCKLENASKAGYINAEARLRELEPTIQGHLDMLKLVGGEAAVYMGCGPQPEGLQGANQTASWAGGDAVVAMAAAKPAGPPAAAAQPPSKPTGWQRFGIMLVSILFEMSFILLCACLYNRVRLKTAFPQDKGSDGADRFAYSLFGCFMDWRICMLSFCCLPLRWADTMDKANSGGRTISYWHGLALVLGFWVVNLTVTSAAQHPFLGSFFTFALYCMHTMFRQRLRRRYEIGAGSLRSIAEDFCAWLCCPCCATAQEARHVEAMRLDGN